MKTKSMRGTVVWFSLLLLCAACAPQPRPGDTPAARPGGPLPGEDITISIDDPEIVRLWQEADVARALRDYPKATNLLERAIRLRPGEPLLWSRVAEIQLLAGQTVLAENFAAKSNSLATHNAALRYRNWLIIMHARAARNDPAGVEEARQHLQKLQPSPAPDPLQ